ncbi:MAG: hypothetical protein CFE31_14980 [Rhizobiales bacterium PAR1]|nr:MAG: hypothetical protein CFE31_14980 [Rhizobiales bacterium PAR1]
MTPPYSDYRPMLFPDELSDKIGPYFSRISAGKPIIGLGIRDFHISPRGFCHGAVIAALADLQSLPSGYMAGIFDRLAATLSFNIDYIASARLGDWIELKTDLLKVTRQFIFSQALVVKTDGAVVARTSAVYKFDPHPHPDADIVTRLFPPEQGRT